MSAAERIGAAAEARAAARLAAALGDVPGVRATREGTVVTARGRGLLARRLEEPALRWPGAAP